ncbi:MAG TPA: class I SAM-dependent methyltransferase [Mycobacteriales bacterium]|nr:class I SAM-dependent methyltransferase [Mycobacteriales bacterium]
MTDQGVRDRHEFLRRLHERLQPRSYLEIGVRDGLSLTLSRAPSIAIDPAFKITSEVHADLQLVRATSDDFFARPDPLAHLPGGRIDLAFIDGMHLAEFALRDFINVERFTEWTSVVVLDDMLPRSVAEAARDRHTLAWAGDVYKVATILQRLRPELVCLPIDTAPTGVVLVLGVDKDDRTLPDKYDELLAELTAADPQDVPEEVLTRVGSADPAQVLDSPVWAALVQARSAGAAPDRQLFEQVRSLAGTGPVVPVLPPVEQPWPQRKRRQQAGAKAGSGQRRQGQQGARTSTTGKGAAARRTSAGGSGARRWRRRLRRARRYLRGLTTRG